MPIEQELKHFGVLGMKWGQRKAVVDVARQKRDVAAKGKDYKSANKEYKRAKQQYKTETVLNKHQKRVRLGATIAATLVTGPVGLIAVPLLSTSHYRAQNDIGKAAVDDILKKA